MSSIAEDFEVRRRARFAEWLEAFRARLLLERRKASSAQLLVAQVESPGSWNGEVTGKKVGKFLGKLEIHGEDLGKFTWKNGGLDQKN